MAEVELSEPVRIVVTTVSTPLGGLRLVAADGRLCAAEFDDCDDRLAVSLRRRFRRRGYLVEAGGIPRLFRTALDGYFGGDLAAIDRLDLEPAGTPFQRAVWTHLRTIPAGSTLSYAAMAAAIGRSSAVRAVGHANGANPLSVLIPCHRLVGTSGSLTGYGGGLHRKRWLLEHEARFARLHGRVPGGG